MSCTDVLDLIDAYLDGELDPVANLDIEQHLRDCPGCDRACQEHKALIKAINSGSPYEKRPHRVCASAFNPPCERNFLPPRAVPRQRISPLPGQSLPGCRRFFSRRLGAGWRSQPPSFSPHFWYGT